ncbi:hypothetical protein, partial [Bacillus velezensis]|uniref:hypothetical protein n=1 Tax=Bacillus velezensis TaxID=492670 RepID=UPI0020C0A590
VYTPSAYFLRPQTFCKAICCSAEDSKGHFKNPLINHFQPKGGSLCKKPDFLLLILVAFPY